MRVPGLLLRRARAQAGTLLTLLILVTCVAAVLAGSIGYTRAASVATVHDTLEDAAPTAAGIQVQTRIAEDAPAQDAALRAAVARHLGGTELDVARALRTEPASATVAGADGGAGGEAEPVQVRVVLGELPADPADITVTGDLPGAGEVLVPEQSAADSGLEPGTVLTLRDTTLTVSGTWQALDPEARAWFADPMVAAGADGTTYGPLLTGAETITDVDPAPFVRWTIYPRAADLSVADLPGLQAGMAELDHALDNAVAVRGLTIEGTLAQTLAELELATSTAAAVGLVPVALLAIISLVALVQVVRLLGLARSREVEILVARGAHPRQVTLWSGAEIAVVSVLGAALGTAVALVVVGRLDGGAAERGLVLAVGAVVAVLALAGGTVVAGLQARAVARRLVADRSGRLQSAAAVGSVALAAAAAVLSSWQLLRHGSPLITADDGTTQADVLAVVSLGAVLGALAMLALVLLGPLTQVVAATRARSRGLAGVLAARQVSRRVRAYAVPLVLVVLAAAATTVASSFAGATVTQREQVSALAVGTDVRVTVPTGATSRLAQPQSVSALPYAGLAGVEGAGVVLRGSGTFGELPVAVTALDTARLTEVMRVPERSGLGPASAGLAPEAGAGIVVPAGTETLELTVRALVATTPEALAAEEESRQSEREYLLSEGLTEAEAEEIVAAGAESARRGTTELRTTLWVLDGDGAPSMLTADPLTVQPEGTGGPDVGPEPAEHTLRVALPGPDEYRVVALDVGLQRYQVDTELSYEVRSVTADGEDLALGDAAWARVAEPAVTELEPAGSIGITGTVRYDWQLPDPALLLRLVPEPPPAQVPAVLSEHLAITADLGAGDRATVHLRGAGIAITVSDIVPAVPGGLEADAVLLDLGALSRYLLGEQGSVLLPGDVWLALEPDLVGDVAAAREVADAARTVGGPQAVTDVAGDDLTDSAASVRETFWITAAGAVLLALTGVAAVALALARERRNEVMVLRALGLPPGRQARSRSAELLGVGALGAVLGVAAGWAAAALLVPTLARAAATESTALPLGRHLELAPALLLLAVLAAGLVVVAVVVAARVRAQALDAEYREEVR
ncbi:FtsX-like permease family protein [Georgenia sp. MJ173]|uniref:FtsX-like permease family protein n=1 Tax=Georgenia sunbinii TaxID=3117728 RepID=UPI002F263FB9